MRVFRFGLVRFTLAPLALATLLAACSGGGGSSPTPTTNNTINMTPTTSKTVMIQVNFTIPGGVVTSSNSRSPQFVSNTIKSAILTAYQPTVGARGNIDFTNKVSTYADLSSTSPNCTVNGNGSRSCSIFLPAPVTAACVPAAGADGCDFFEIDTYSGNPSPSTPCGGGASPACTGVNGNQLSIGTDGGNGVGNSPNGIDNGYTVAAGSNINVSLGLQGIINTFVLTSPASYPSGVGAAWPVPFSDTTHPLLVLSAVAGIGANTAVVLETQAGFPNAQDDSGGSKPNIAGGTCTNGDLFANGITTNATGAGPFFAVDGGAGGSNQTQLKLQPCGTSGFQTSPTQGINTYFPNDQIQGTYLGGGSAGAQEPSGGNHPPYFAYITGTTYTMFTTGVPAQNNWVSPPATSSAYAHPYPLSPTPGCGVTSGCTFVDAAARQLLSARRPEVIFGNQVNIAVAPLFAQTYHGAVGAGESDSAANGHAILALNGPGDSGRVFADQVVAPSFGTNGNGGNLGNSYAATASSGCSGTVNGMPQVAATISIPGIGTGSATFFGAQWIVTAGNLPSNGSGAPTTSCVITLSDGVNSVPVWISNSVAGGGATIIIGAIPPRLFVADQAGNNVQIYNSPFTGSPSPSVTVSSGLNGPAGVAFDSGGSLYVANINSNTVQIYTQPFSGASSPSATISTGLNQPVFLAFDAGGKLYVANYAGQTVTIYNPPFSGASSPSATISAGLSDPNGVAFDSGGNLYVSNQLGSTVQIYTPPFSGASSPSTTISTGLNIPLGLAFDSSGNLYVANAIGSTVPIYHPPFSGASSPSATISTGANGPNGLAFDAGGNLYVAITSNNTVQIYNPPFSGSSSPSATITSGLNAPYGLAFH